MGGLNLGLLPTIQAPETPSILESRAKGASIRSALGDIARKEEAQNYVGGHTKELNQALQEKDFTHKAVQSLMIANPEMYKYMTQAIKDKDEQTLKNAQRTADFMIGAVPYITHAESRGMTKQQAWDDYKNFARQGGVPLGQFDQMPYSDNALEMLKNSSYGVKNILDTVSNVETKDGMIIQKTPLDTIKNTSQIATQPKPTATPKLDSKGHPIIETQNLGNGKTAKFFVMSDGTRSKVGESSPDDQSLQQQKAPPGYRFKADGNLEIIPGGPADLKQQGVYNADTASMQSSSAQLDRLAIAANELMNHKGLPKIFGISGAFPNIPGSQAADAEALKTTLLSQVGFSVLQSMRDASKTGGALGAITEKELSLLQNNLAAIGKAQSFEQAKKELQKIIDFANSAKERLRSAYNFKYQQKKDYPKTNQKGWKLFTDKSGNQAYVSPDGRQVEEIK